MPQKSGDVKPFDFDRAAQLLETHWQTVATEASGNPELEYIADAPLREAIRVSVTHKQVAYRFCLPVQILGKLTDPTLDALRLQKKKGDKNDVTGWDARSLASKVFAPFNQRQENILGTSSDPYVSNPMRIPRMARDDTSKKEVTGWNTLVGILEQVESRGKAALEERVAQAFAGGQNLYVFDFFELSRSVLALGGESIRITFVQKVGEHLDLWNTQPAHRQAWKRLLETL